MGAVSKKYTAIIVLYNKSILNSITCSGIKKLDEFDIDVLIIDNSDIDYGNAVLCRNLDYRYISMEGNKGLSKAYNVAIDNVNSEVLILLDDDTEITKDYFMSLNQAVDNFGDVDIFAPIVYGQDGIIYSPNSFNFLKNKYIKSEMQQIPQDSFNAIASCLAIRKQVFNDYRFNETLFVDQVDQFFCCEQRKRGRKFMKLNTIVHQNFYQRGDGLTPKYGWTRLKLRIIDISRHARLMGEVRYVVLGFIKCCGLSIQIAKKTKSLKIFLKGVLLTCKLIIHPQ